MTALQWQIVGVAVAAIFSALFVLGYLCFAPWWKSGVGRSRIFSDVSLSTLLWLSLLAYWLHFVLPDWASTAIIWAIAVGSVYQLGVFVEVQIRKRRADRGN